LKSVAEVTKDFALTENILQGPDVSLSTGMSTLCRIEKKAKRSDASNRDLLGLKVEKGAGKKQALDPTSQIGALRQVHLSSCSCETKAHPV
jgi:hypothetical protein